MFLRVLRGKKMFKQFSAPLRVPRGQKKAVLRAPPCPPWKRDVQAVLRAPPRPPRTKKGSSPCSSVSSVEKRCSSSSPRPSASPADKKRQFSVPLRVSPWKKDVQAVLRAPPRPPRTKKSSSPCPSVSLRGQKVLNQFSAPLRVLRGQKRQFSVPLRVSPWTKGVKSVLRALRGQKAVPPPFPCPFQGKAFHTLPFLWYCVLTTVVRIFLSVEYSGRNSGRIAPLGVGLTTNGILALKWPRR